MQNPRFHGNPPYSVVAVHGGPGAAGSAYPLASGLAATCGVLEPMQTALTVDGQAEELAGAILRHASPPAVLIGHSWGAWLAILTAARHPELVRKLILVGSGPFEERWTAGMMETRLGRLPAEEAQEARELLASFTNESLPERDARFARFGQLITKADTCCPAPQPVSIEALCDSAINESVWAEAEELRRSGALLAAAGAVRCPVLAVHGDWDPHPWQGVKEPLQAAVRDFRFVLLWRCGHDPWDELYARDQFFAVLRAELEG